jgi:crotonobetainyl-CoA:carnitine CoA-transferase CaiB-like acyl-CoA transferase
MDMGIGDDALRDVLTDIFATRTQAEWTELFIAHNIAGAPYYSLSETPNTPLFSARHMFLDQFHADPAQSIRTIANAVKVAGQQFEIRHAAPAMGEHTTEILAEVGVSESRIQQLVDARVALQATSTGGHP